MDNYHIPVLLDEAISGLKIKDDGLYIDATVGGGGHTEEILKLGGRVIGIDQDTDSIKHLNKKFESEIKEGKLTLIQGNFSNLENIAANNKIEKIDGILFDLGVSSHQIDTSGKGFTFQKDEVLDMRMGEGTHTAEEIINTLSAEQLYEIFAKYGEEPKAKEVAHAIVSARKKQRISTTRELKEIIQQVIRNTGKIHPATRVFQALRIAVNDEINSLKIGIEAGFKLLREGGRMEVISFHSLEDRICKLSFLDFERKGVAKIVTKKPLVAQFDEVGRNRRSRSAKLRICEKI